MNQTRSKIPDGDVLALKFIIGLLLLPACWVSFETFFLLFKREALSGAIYRSPEFFFFTAGAVACSLVFLIARRNRVLMWLYVAGHELTHTLFAMIFRGQVSRIQISPGGGHILTNRNNFIISLSPYFVPFYTLLVIPAWRLLDWLFVDFTERDIFWLYGLIGMTWMFHIAYTVMMLRQRQTDVEENGKLFSFVVILLVNLLLISALLVAASPEATLSGFGVAWFHNLETFGERFRESIGELFRML